MGQADALDTASVLRLLLRELPPDDAPGEAASASKEPDELLRELLRRLRSVAATTSAPSRHGHGTPATPAFPTTTGKGKLARSLHTVLDHAAESEANAFESEVVVDRAVVVRLQRDLEAARLNVSRAAKRERELLQKVSRLEAELQQWQLQHAHHDAPETREMELRLLCQELARAEARARAEAKALRNALSAPADVRLAKALREVEQLRTQLSQVQGAIGDEYDLRQQLGMLALHHDALSQAEQARDEQARRYGHQPHGEAGASEPGAAMLRSPSADSGVFALAGRQDAEEVHIIGGAFPASPPGKTLDEALADLAETRAQLSPLPPSAEVAGSPEAMEAAGTPAAVFVPAELSDGDASPSELELEDDIMGTENAVARAEAALHAAQTESARLTEQEQAVRKAADMQAANAQFEAETARSASAAAAAAASALAAEDPRIQPKLFRQLQAAKARAEEEAARAERGAYNAAEAARTAAAAAAAAAEAAAFARATATAKAFALQHCVSAQRRRADHSAKCRALMGQTEKLAASLRSERAAWESCKREAEGLLAVLQTNGKSGPWTALQEDADELERLVSADTGQDFQPRGALPKKRLDIIAALASERDRMSSRLAHVQGLHEGGRNLVRRLSARLVALKEEVAQEHRPRGLVGEGAKGIGERIARLF